MKIASWLHSIGRKMLEHGSKLPRGVARANAQVMGNQSLLAAVALALGAAGTRAGSLAIIPDTMTLSSPAARVTSSSSSSP